MTRKLPYAMSAALIAIASVNASSATSVPVASIAQLPLAPAPARDREAPMLASAVGRGELPSLEKRIPANPMVVKCVEKLGQYGGTWRTYHIGNDLQFRRLDFYYYGLTRWNPTASDIIPGLAESWAYIDGGKAIEFHLRRGLKWSDGVPFTSADIMFWWNMCCDDRVIYKPPEWAFRDGVRMEVEAPDEYTVRFKYSKPFYFVELFTATGFWTCEEMILPAHYLKQFHPDYNRAYSEFRELIRRNNVFNNPDRPTMAPWRLSRYDITGDFAVFERNPYYWAVDETGRQLPYIDRIESYRVRDAQSGALMVLSGEIDAQFRGMDQRDYALLKKRAEKGNYRILRWEEGTAAWYSICLNWSPEDPERRELFRKKEFRRGLSVAIDREKIRQIAWNGLGRPQAGAISDDSWHFRSARGQELLKRWRTEWSQHDPTLARTMLTEAGLDQIDADGHRMYKGKPFRLVLECWDDQLATEEANLVAEDFRSVGVNTLVHSASGADLFPRVQQGRVEMYTQHNSEMDLFSFPAWVFPTKNINWHPSIGRWYMTGGKEGEAPEGFMKDLLDIYEKCKAEPDIAKRHELVLDAIEIHLREGPFFLGTVGRQPVIVVAKNDFRNIPQTGVLGPLAICQPGSVFPEQFFFDRPALPSSTPPAQIAEAAK